MCTPRHRFGLAAGSAALAVLLGAGPVQGAGPADPVAPVAPPAAGVAGAGDVRPAPGSAGAPVVPPVAVPARRIDAATSGSAGWDVACVAALALSLLASAWLAHRRPRRAP
ncbi:hypothetical protein [Streptomyces sp. NPDC060194]|uniref:hypothetical protein n=1 Tax=Streptomyces sp. NPDC060194 TaxID=3347069 RepID=UPI00364E5F7B